METILVSWLESSASERASACEGGIVEILVGTSGWSELAIMMDRTQRGNDGFPSKQFFYSFSSCMYILTYRGIQPEAATSYHLSLHMTT